ncbi:hypothetical protein RSAG8_07730, partial [Rhizoctonia solani AG-8 WAC10335]
MRTGAIIAALAAASTAHAHATFQYLWVNGVDKGSTCVRPPLNNSPISDLSSKINVTGGGSANPATVKFPGAYSPTDPGILFDLYGGYTSYTIPGPAVYVPGSPTGGGGTPTTTTTRAATTTTSSAAPVSTGPVVVKYGQCGGQGWTGGTTCAAGSTCTVVNAFYSQCL